MNLNLILQEIPWTPIVFLLGQAAAFALWIFNNGKKTEANEKAIIELTKRIDHDLDKIEKENAELKRDIRELRDILIQVKSSTDLLMLGRIKTGRREEA